MLLATFEEREPEFVGVDLLLRSLARTEPDAELVFATTPENETTAREIVSRHPKVSLLLMEQKRWGYTIKPELLLRVLERHGRPVMWIDSDIVVCRPFLARLAQIPADTLISTWEYQGAKQTGSRIRCEMLGRREQRHFPRTVNSAIVRVTDAHAPLLEAWRARMRETDFVSYQERPPEQRPHWLSGDQCVLTLLLASSHADVPVHLLDSGLDIAHELPGAGYTLRERLHNLRRGQAPYFAHAIGDAKPWRKMMNQSVGHMKLSSIDLSLYVHVARSLFTEGSWPAFLEATTWDARLTERLTFKNPLLKGLAHTAGYSAARALYRAFRPAR